MRSGRVSARRSERHYKRSSTDVTFETLTWSGRNSARDRLEATFKLLESCATSDGEPQLNSVVAHSHGGNIAADAILADASYRHGEKHGPS
jgi:hypothetical protein